MPARLIRHSVEFISALGLFAVWRLVIAASAVALISVTVIAPPTDGISVFPPQLDMRAKTHGELAVSNQSTQWREIRIELTALTGEAGDCGLHYSPTSSHIPFGATQVIRVLHRMASERACQTDYLFIITDRALPDTHRVEVPLTIAAP